MASITISFSEACERNKEPILEIIQPLFKGTQRVLEIGSGTGQHAVYFAQQMPHIEWQTSDQELYIKGIESQLNHADLANALRPIEIEVSQKPWLPVGTFQYDAVFTANTLHIMSWEKVNAFFEGMSEVLRNDGLLVIYGPFTYQGKFTSNSNAQFDHSLKQRNPLSGIREFEDVNELAMQQSLELIADHKMPANNQCLVWRKVV